jgi:hypothetical protein
VLFNDNIYFCNTYPNADVRNPRFQEYVHDPFSQKPLRAVLQMEPDAFAMFPAAVDSVLLLVYVKSMDLPCLVADST